MPKAICEGESRCIVKDNLKLPINKIKNIFKNNFVSKRYSEHSL